MIKDYEMIVSERKLCLYAYCKTWGYATSENPQITPESPLKMPTSNLQQRGALDPLEENSIQSRSRCKCKLLYEAQYQLIDVRVS
jgi:hypothetical protein